MGKLGATIAKELLLLCRDRAGLVILFLMPAVLVVVISLVQENVMEATGEAGIRILFIDRDGQRAGKTLSEQLDRSGAVTLVSGPADMGDEAARSALADGEYQFCVIAPENLTENLQERVYGQMVRAFGQENEESTAATPELIVYFDPLVRGSFRAAVINALEGIVLSLEMELKARAFSEAVSRQAGRAPGSLPGAGGFPKIDPGWGRERLLQVHTRQASRGGFEQLPSSVQHNVPAWALFGIFFIAVPMGGSLIRERQQGTLTRLMSFPVSYAVLLLGKVLAYVLVCLCQFAVIVVMGIYLLPLLGTPELHMGSAYGAILLVVVSAALAAASYGILLGAFARTYEQASMFGAVSVVIAAALGGIMVPVYAMPEVMQQISRFSPLAWGLNALTDLFVREGGLGSVMKEIAFLLLFSAAATAAGRWRIARRERLDL